MTITEGALFGLFLHGTAALSPGTVFTAIDNRVATPINGTFSNLPDGDIVPLATVKNSKWITKAAMVTI